MDQRRGIADVFSDLTREITTLFRTEVRLAKTEVSEKITQIGVGAGLIVGSAVLFMAALLLLLEAAVAALAELAGLSVAASSLIVGVIVAVIGGVVLMMGLNRLKSTNLAPEKTVEQLQRDAALAKHQVTSS
jgi:hypothetical protein